MVGGTKGSIYNLQRQTRAAPGWRDEGLHYIIYDVAVPVYLDSAGAQLVESY